MRKWAILAAAVGLAACGGNRMERSYGGVPEGAVSFASGPIATACMTSGRREANRQLCRCVQAVADETLNVRDQAMAVEFFRDPHRAQEIKMEKDPVLDAFWDRYIEFADASESLCRPHR